MKEIWKDIPNYEGLYQISNFGNVKSLKRKVKNKNGYRDIKEKILHNYINKNGYYAVTLRKNCNIEVKLIHRLIAEMFIPNPNNYPCINHKDGNKSNNSINNLEWCSYSYNTKEAFRLGLNKHIDFKEKKKISQYDLEGNFIKEWKSIYNASKITGIARSCISKVCNHNRYSAGGYLWRFKEEF